MTSADAVSEIFALYEGVGHTGYLGEAVSKTQHSIQCGMQAEADGAPEETVLAAFLHDIGHLLGARDNLPEMITDDVNIGTSDHDVIGGDYLRRKGFPAIVCDIVAGHVQAKRYLVLKENGYYENLSDASKKTLVHQGGKMSVAEAEAFESSAVFDDIIRMRRWDEMAKDPLCEHAPLDKFKRLCEKVLIVN